MRAHLIYFLCATFDMHKSAKMLAGSHTAMHASTKTRRAKRNKLDCTYICFDIFFLYVFVV